MLRRYPGGGARRVHDISSDEEPEETDFDQSRFGYRDLTNFGQIQFWSIHFWPIHFWIWCVSWPQRSGAQTQKNRAPKGGATRVEPEPRKKWDPVPSPASHFRTFVSLWRSSRVFLVVFLKRRGRQMFTFGVLGLSCEALEGPETAGVSHDNPRAQTCTFQGPHLQKHHQNSNERSSERGRKNENCGGRGEKKSEILGGPAEGRSGADPPNTNHNTKQQTKNGLAQIGLAKIGQTTNH